MDNNELLHLRERVSRLEARVADLEQSLGTQHAQPIVQPGPEPKPLPQVKPVALPTRPTKTRESWEQRIGGTWLNRLGVVALLIGLAFFLKYAFDNNWIDEVGRVAIGYGVGALLLAGGFWYRGKGKLPKFASGLGGAGIGAWFISTWAAYNYYQIFPQIPAFVVMAAVTVVGVSLALYWNSPALAGLGLLGGYLTPLLIQGVGGYHVQFTYLLILNIGALAVLVKKNWNALAFISLGFTTLVNLVALITLYEVSFLTPFMLFLSAYHLLFAIQGLTANLVHRSPARPPVLGVSIASGGIYLLFSSILLYADHRSTLALVFLAWGLFYLAQMGAVLKWRRGDRHLGFVLLSLALGYLVVAVPIQFSEAWITMIWTVMAAVLIVMGWKTGAARLRGWGLVVLGLAIWRLTFIDLGLYAWVGWLVNDTYIAPWTARLPAMILVVLVMLLTAWLYREKVSKFERSLVPWLVSAAITMVLVFTLGEWNRWYYYLGMSPGFPWRAYRATAWTKTMAANLGVLLALWRFWKYRPLKVLLLVFMPLAILWAALFDVKILSGAVFTAANYLSPWMGRLPGALLVAALTFLALWQFWTKGKKNVYLSCLAVGANFLILGAALTESSRYYNVFRATFSQPWQVYRNTAWSALMSGHGFILVAVGIWRKSSLFRRLGIGLLLLTVAKITLVDLTGLETIWRILVFTGTGLVLILASWLYQKFVSPNLEIKK